MRFTDDIPQKQYSVVFLCYQLHLIKHTFILSAARGNIYARGFYGTMAQHICQMGEILLNRIKGTGKKMPQVMWEYLAPFHMRRVAEPFHVVANIRPIERLAAFGAEYCARVYTLPPRIFHKFFTQLARYYDCAAFALQPYFYTPLFYRIYCYVAQLAYPYPRCADGLHDKAQPIVPSHVRRVDQPFIFRSAQFPAFVYKSPSLHL